MMMDTELIHNLLARDERENENRGPSLVMTGVLLLTVATLVLGARIYCRAVIVKGMGPDDWCMIFAAMLATPIVVNNIVSVAGGVGRHTWIILAKDPRGEQQAIRLGWISMVHYFLSLGLTKAALLLFLIRLGPGTALYYTSWCLLVFVTIYTIIAFVLSIVQCIPVSYMWGGAASAKCVDRRTMGLVLYSISIVTDFAIWVTPMKKVLSLRIPTRQKAALVFVFSLGSLSVLAGILRMKAVNNSFTTKDPMYENVDLGIWSMTEVFIGIICGSAPAVKPLFSKFLPGFLGHSQITPPVEVDNVRRGDGPRSWGDAALGSWGDTEGASTEEFRGAAEAESVGVEVELEVIDVEVVGKDGRVELVDRV